MGRLLTILAQVAGPFLEHHVHTVTGQPLTILAQVAGPFLELLVLPSILRHVTHIIHVHRVDPYQVLHAVHQARMVLHRHVLVIIPAQQVVPYQVLLAVHRVPMLRMRHVHVPILVQVEVVYQAHGATLAIIRAVVDYPIL
jgi:hypothetical protein